MKIVNLQVENVKRLSAVNIKPSGDVVVIGGKNGAGKSSVLDSIMYALAGGKSLPEKPLKEGTKGGYVTVDVGDFVVTRKFSRKGDETVSTSLEIRTAEGFKASSPQALLDSLYGKMTFDPIEFSRLKPKDQLDTLKNLVGIDFSDLDREKEQIYTERTEINRSVSEKNAQIKNIGFAPDLGVKQISIYELMEELESINEKNSANRDIKNNYQKEVEKLSSINGEILRISRQMEELANRKILLEKEVDNQTNKIREIESQIKPDIDTSELSEKIKEAELINHMVRQNINHLKLSEEIKILSEEANKRTEQIKSIEKEKMQLIANANFPVDGLGLDENGVTMNGIPFEQCSSAEKLRISVAMGIALNPKLRIMQIRDGSLLDEESLKLVEEMAVQSNTQVWIERVGEGKECSVIIADGHVKETV